jgi:hypothetical protein
MMRLKNCLTWFVSSCLLAAIIASAACGSGSQPTNKETAAPGTQPASGGTATGGSQPSGGGTTTTGTGTASAVDLSTPDAPLRLIFKAAEQKNFALYRSAFAETINPRIISEQRFIRFTKRVREKTIELEDKVENISETEAIAKFKSNRRDVERDVRVRKFGDRWLIVEFVR